MSRIAMLLVAIVMAFGFVVAIVRAQDSSRDDGHPGDDRLQRSVLKKALRSRETTPAVREQVNPHAEASPSQPVGTGVRSEAIHRSPLVDRLKQIRGSVTGEDRQGRVTPLGSPLRVGTPSRIQPPLDPPADSGGPANEPQLLPGQLGEGSLRGPIGAPAEFDGEPRARGILADRGESARRSRQSDSADETPPAELNSGAGTNSDALGHPLENPAYQGELSQRDLAVRDPSEGPSQLFSSQAPALLIDAVGPPSVVVGQEAEYRVALTNQSPVVAHDVSVRIALPTWVEVSGAEVTVGGTQLKGDEASAQELIWKTAQVGSGARELLSLKVIPRENRSFNLAVDWTLRPVPAVAQIQVQQPELQMAVFGPDRIDYGATAVLTIQLSNPGTGRADDVVLEFGYGSEQLPPKRIGALAAGETTEVRVELNARQAGVLRVAAAATAAGGLTAEAVKQVQVQRAKIEVEVTGSKMLFAGTATAYEFRVRNTGDAEAVDVAAEIMLPPGAKCIGEDSAGRASESLARQLGTISPGSERQFKLICQLTNPGENLIEARVTAAGNLGASDTFVTRVEAIADLKLNVDDSAGPIPVNTETVYELRIVNRGSRAAKDVHLVAQFSEGVEPVSASGAGARIVPGQVLFQVIPRIQPGEEVQLRITAKAEVPGNHRFRAELKCSEPVGTVLSEEESTYFFSADQPIAEQSGETAVR